MCAVRALVSVASHGTRPAAHDHTCRIRLFRPQVPPTSEAPKWDFCARRSGGRGGFELRRITRTETFMQSSKRTETANTVGNLESEPYAHHVTRQFQSNLSKTFDARGLTESLNERFLIRFKPKSVPTSQVRIKRQNAKAFCTGHCARSSSSDLASLSALLPASTVGSAGIENLGY